MMIHRQLLPPKQLLLHIEDTSKRFLERLHRSFHVMTGPGFGDSAEKNLKWYTVRSNAKWVKKQNEEKLNNYMTFIQVFLYHFRFPGKLLPIFLLFYYQKYCIDFHLMIYYA